MGIEDDITREISISALDEDTITPPSRLKAVDGGVAISQILEIIDPDILEIQQFLIEAGFRRNTSGPIAPDDYFFERQWRDFQSNQNKATVTIVKVLFQEDGKGEKWNLIIKKVKNGVPARDEGDAFAKGELFSAIVFIFDRDEFFKEMKMKEIDELGGAIPWRCVFEIRRSVRVCLEMGFERLEKPCATVFEGEGEGLILGFRKNINSRVMIVVFKITREDKSLIFDVNVCTKSSREGGCESEHFIGKNYREAMDTICRKNTEFVDGSR